MAKAKINEMAEKLRFSSREKKRGKKDKFCMEEFWEYGKVLEVLVLLFLVFFFVIIKLGVMGLSVLDCGTPYR